MSQHIVSVDRFDRSSAVKRFVANKYSNSPQQKKILVLSSVRPLHSTIKSIYFYDLLFVCPHVVVVLLLKLALCDTAAGGRTINKSTLIVSFSQEEI